MSRCGEVKSQNREDVTRGAPRRFGEANEAQSAEPPRGPGFPIPDGPCGGVGFLSLMPRLSQTARTKLTQTPWEVITLVDLFCSFWGLSPSRFVPTALGSSPTRCPRRDCPITHLFCSFWGLSPSRFVPTALGSSPTRCRRDCPLQGEDNIRR